MFYICDCCRSRAEENVCYFDMCAYFNVSNFTLPVCCAPNIHRPSERTNTTVPDSLGSLSVDKNVSHDTSTGDIDTATKVVARESVAGDIEQEKETKSDNTISEEAPAATPCENMVTPHGDITSESKSDVIIRTLSSSEVTHVRTASTARAAITASVNFESSVSPSISSTDDNDAEFIDTLAVSDDITSATLEPSMDIVTHGGLAVTPTMTLGDTIMTQTVTKSSSNEHISTELASSAVTTDDVKATPTLSSSVTKPTLTPQTPTHTDDPTRGHITPDRQDKPVVQDSPKPTSNYTAKVNTFFCIFTYPFYTIYIHIFSTIRLKGSN